MTIRVGINGFGRIGRDFVRNVTDRDDTGIEVVAANDIMAPATMAHLLRYDSTYGPWRRTITSGEDTLHVDDVTIRITSERDPERGPQGRAVRPGQGRGRHHRPGRQRRRLRTGPA
jgi:glyceraldehyde 3-phosphate dehydrogenase